jgi:NADH-quinone oxidoreductase subunit K
MSVLTVVAGLFSLGLYGVLTRRDIIAILACVEIMVGAGLVLLVSLGGTWAAESGGSVQAVALLLLVLAASEAAVGLALLVAVARRIGTARLDELTEVKG